MNCVKFIEYRLIKSDLKSILRIKLFVKKTFLILIFVTVGYVSAVIAQSGYGADISGITATPAGKNSKIYNTGFGGLVGFYYDANHIIRIALSLGYFSLGLNAIELNNTLKEENNGSANIRGSSNAIPVIVSFRLITSGPNMRFYGLFEAGIYTYWSKAEGTYFSGEGNVPIDQSEFRSEAGFSLGGGVLYPLSERLNLDVNLRYTFIQDSEYLILGNTSISQSQVLLFGIGLNLFFPL